MTWLHAHRVYVVALLIALVVAAAIGSAAGQRSVATASPSPVVTSAVPTSNTTYPTQATGASIPTLMPPPSEQTPIVFPPTPEVYKPIVITTKTDKRTSPFAINASLITVTLTNKGGSCAYAGSFVSIYPAGSQDAVDYPFTVDGCTSASTEIMLDGPGDYYVEIGTANTTTTLTILPHD